MCVVACRFTISSPVVDGTSEILHAVVKTDAGDVINDNYIPFAPPKQMSLPSATVTTSVADAQSGDGTVKITVTTDNFALCVTFF